MRAVCILFTIVFSLATISISRAATLTPEEIQTLRAILDAPPPNPKQYSRPQLAQIYLQRGRAARELGESETAVKEFNEGLRVVGGKNPASYVLHHELAVVNFDRGEHRRGLAARKAALAVARTLPRQLYQTSRIAFRLAILGEREEAKQYLARAEELLGGARNHNGWLNNGNRWTGDVAMAKGRFNQEFGYFKESEEDLRRCMSSLRAYLRINPNALNIFPLSHCTRSWIEVALLQGRLREANAIADELGQLTRDFAEMQGRPLFVSRMAPTTARVYIEQGRLKEAKDLLQKTIGHYKEEILDEEDVTKQSSPVISRRLEAIIEMLQQDWQKAEEKFRETREPVPLWAYTLLKLGRLKDSLQMLKEILEEGNKRYDEKSLYLWENRAFHALAVGASGEREEAVKTLSVALPKILEMSRPEGTSGEAGLFNTTRLNWLIDGYVSFLSDLYKSGGRVEGVDLVSEAFRYSDIARASRVQGALTAAIVRASQSDPTLAAVVRRAQDLEYQVHATAQYLTALQSQPSSPETEKLITAKRAELEQLRVENEKAQQELKEKLPDYSELLSPKPVDVVGAQKLLRAGEALISIYTMPERTLVWAIPAQGQASLAVVDISNTAIAEIVAKLRRALDPSVVDIRQQPSFDFVSAHDLYKKLLEPVESGWKDAQALLIVPHGRLSELPFSVLVTGPFQASRSDVAFASHAEAPWLIKRAAISYLPSVAGLAALRRGGTQAAERRFIGFGDPVFAASKANEVVGEMSSRGLKRENLSTADTREGGAQLESLPPLPDTAQEVSEIGKILQADESRDIHLGRSASENRVKISELSKYRTVMFATHGLVPGDLTDLAQPALALSNPKIIGENEDGLLTLTEILGLKLQADWVVLSACNTASADGQASEAVSGLGRAFFFAGAKALLVSHWPVETVSARLLTTELFKRQTADPKLGRATAMREASLAVMQQSASSRARSYSYAHPMFWAPFVVVGDGG